MKITGPNDIFVDRVPPGKMSGDEPALVQIILGKFRAEIAGDMRL